MQFKSGTKKMTNIIQTSINYVLKQTKVKVKGKKYTHISNYFSS